ncbi:hypothetical protein BJ165DRAFT_1405761 [Panaeolus papilionaceus]|nr:hypothetical protein BJ165DRAFT_1405761 [Panaeolus papilionaceus]
MANFPRHLPLLTSCIEFGDKPITPLPVVTAEVDFGSPDPLLQEDIQNVPDRERSPTLSVAAHESDKIASPLTYNKVPKPPGQPGRPQSGGYSLDIELKRWGPLFGEVKSFVHAKCDSLLDLTKSYSKQDKLGISTVVIDTKQAYPIVDGYQNSWPVHDFMKMYLKNMSENHRKDTR